MSERTRQSDSDRTMGGERPPKRLSREDVAKLEIGRTDVSRRQTIAIVALFLLTILSIPVWQHIHALRTNLPAYRTAEPEQRRLVDLLPRVYHVGELMLDWQDIYVRKSWWGAYRALPGPDDIKAYETAVEESSVLAEAVLGPVQWTLTAAGGTGNEEAITGVDGWLFYAPDVRLVTGEPFLDDDRLQAIKRYSDIQPDPVAAIIQFRDQLAARGIELILLPTPVKPQVHPEYVTPRYDPDALLAANPSYDRFLAQMREAGVAVIDPLELMRKRKQAGEPIYLPTDTHWTPRMMQAVADAVAGAIELPAGENAAPGYERGEQTVVNDGDIVTMLKLPPGQDLYPPTSVTIHPITTANGEPWRPFVGARILLLGDSFTNIYATANLGWGQSAGFAEQLSFALNEPLDRIAINAGGAYASRAALADQLRVHYQVYEDTGQAPGRERLADKKVVIYQFATRELMHGDWELIDLPEANPDAFGELPDQPRPIDEAWIEVTGRIEAISRPPRPGSVPYKDAIIAIHLTDVRTDSDDLQPDPAGLLIYAQGMKDNIWTPAARLNEGQQVTLRIRPWADVEAEFGSMQKRDLGTDADFLFPIYWTTVR